MCSEDRPSSCLLGLALTGPARQWPKNMPKSLERLDQVALNRCSPDETALLSEKSDHIPEMIFRSHGCRLCWLEVSSRPWSHPGRRRRSVLPSRG